MRIAYLSFVEIDIANACLVHTREIAEQLARLGHEVTIFMPRPKEKQQWQGVDHVWIPLWAFSGSRLYLARVEMALTLALLHRQKRFDLVYLREMDNNSVIPAVCNWLRLPVFIEVNGWLLSFLRSEGASPRKLAGAKKRQGRHFRNAAGIVISTQGVAQRVAEHYNIEKDVLLVQELGSNPDFFRPGDKRIARAALNLPVSAPIFLFAGSFAFTHDVSLLLDAFSHCLSAHNQSLLILVGEGISQKAIQERVTQLGISARVIFTGSVPYEDVGRWMRAADVGIIPLTASNIRDRDGCMTLKLWDYLASGLPVIVTDHPGTGTYGRLENYVIAVPPGDVKQMTGAMLRLIADEPRRRQLALAGRDLVIKHQTWRHAALATDSFIRKRLQQNG